MKGLWGHLEGMKHAIRPLTLHLLGSSVSSASVVPPPSSSSVPFTRSVIMKRDSSSKSDDESGRGQNVEKRQKELGSLEAHSKPQEEQQMLEQREKHFQLQQLHTQKVPMFDVEAMEKLKDRIGHLPSVYYFVAIADAAVHRVMSLGGEGQTRTGLNAPSVFYNKTIPRVDLHLFLGRLVFLTNWKYGEDNHRAKYPNDYLDTVGIRCLTLANIYIERLCFTNRIKLDRLNVHKLFAAAFMIALKFVEDVQLHSKLHSEISGLDQRSLHSLLVEFSSLSSFRFYVSPEEFTRVFHMFLNLSLS